MTQEQITDVVAEEVTENEVQQTNLEVDTQEALKAQYLAYRKEIDANRFADPVNPEDAIARIKAITDILSLVTYEQKTELRNITGPNGEKQRQHFIIGSTPLDLMKHQFPGLYPILVERLQNLSVKL